MNEEAPAPHTSLGLQYQDIATGIIGCCTARHEYFQGFTWVTLEYVEHGKAKEMMIPELRLQTPARLDIEDITDPAHST